MTTVETALGPVATAELGPTLMHEHIVTRSPGVHENWPHLFDRDAILAIAEGKMADLYGRGIRTEPIRNTRIQRFHSRAQLGARVTADTSEGGGEELVP